MLRHRDRDRENGEAVQIVRRPVERIDDPLVLVLARGAAFFGEDRVVGIVILDDLDDRLFGQLVDTRDVVAAPLLGHFQGLELIDVTYHELAGSASCADGDVEHAVHTDAQRRILLDHKQT